VANLKSILLLLTLAATVNAREHLSFNEAWHFHKGEAPGAEEADFDHSSWRALQLPHDWAIEGPFSDEYNARTGGLPVHGTGWYRKSFTLPQDCQNKRVAITFDGAMYNAHVWINGQFVGNRPYGYSGFQYDLTPYLKHGGPNALAVRLQPEDLSSRWYPGAGIYRNTWLTITEPLHIPLWGVEITTPLVTEQTADITIRTNLRNNHPTQQSATIETVILAPDGSEVTRSTTASAVQASADGTATSNLQISNPKLWDTETPYLYTATTIVRVGDSEVDRLETTFGIRSVQYDPKVGLLLNGRHVRIKGVCMHHDLGALGAAVNRRATERQIEIMKEMGINSIRTAHNPPSTEFLDLCDKMGILVQVEAFDCWQMPKIPNGYNKFFDEWHEADLRDMIRRDRNHPCVIMWSIGNEILEQGIKDGWKLARHLHRICKDEDPTRLTSAGFNYYPASVKNGLAAEVDIPGFNYKPLAYPEVRAQFPDWNILGSETSSCTSSRGVYHLPIEKYEKSSDNQVTSYDLIGPAWAYPPDIEFMALAKTPSVLGEYIWTGFDYLGEPTPYGGRDNSTNGYWNDDWPSRSSYFGAVDLCGFPKDRFFLYQSQWTSVHDNPMVHLLPHWNWSEHTGEAIPVVAYTNASEAELFLNGKSLGRKVKGKDTTPLKVAFNDWEEGDYETPYRLQWSVPFEPGELKVVAYQDGEVVAEKAHHTATAPAAVTLTPDRETIQADGEDLSFITVRIVDEKGHLCPRAINQMDFEITGPAQIVAVDNGNAASMESFQLPTRKAFSGMALVVVRSLKGQSGAVTLQAKSPGLKPASLPLRTR